MPSASSVFLACVMAAMLVTVEASKEESSEGLLSTELIDDHPARTSSASGSVGTCSSSCDAEEDEVKDVFSFLQKVRKEPARGTHDFNSPLHALTTSSTSGTDKVFCWAMITPMESTLVIKQMQLCGGHIAFSNYSNATLNIVKLYEGSMDASDVGGYWNITLPIVRAWQYIASSPESMHFDWFAKVDADTFLRPQHLPQMLEQFSPSYSMAVSIRGRMWGFLEIVSRGALLSEPHFFNDPLHVIELNDERSWHEDIWLTNALTLAKISMVEIPSSNSSCGYYILDLGDEHSWLRDGSPIPALFKAGVSDPLKECVSKDMVAIHAVKDPNVYRALQLLDLPEIEAHVRQTDGGDV